MKPGQGFALDAASRVGREIDHRIDVLVLAQLISPRPSCATERLLQRQIASLRRCIGTMAKEEQEWASILSDASASAQAAAAPANQFAICSWEPVHHDSQAKTLPHAVKAACEQITVQLDALQRALQHARKIGTGTTAALATAMGQVHTHVFGMGIGDARPLVKKLIEVATLRNKENMS